MHLELLARPRELVNRAQYWKVRRLSALYRRRPGGRWRCPCCEFTGHFVPVAGRPNSVCPSCGSAERHRLQHHVLTQLIADRVTLGDVLHIAPDSQLAPLLRSAASSYTTADLDPHGVDIQLDLTSTGLASESVDTVYASHVLEHIADDTAAIGEVHRILRPGGLAVLAVPVTQPSTVEFGRPIARDDYHFRNPGPDYFDRYRSVFEHVEVVTSDAAPPESQAYVYLDRSMPAGSKTADFVAVCHKALKPQARTEASASERTPAATIDDIAKR